jgi:uncharacterized protein (TIGR00725 family)
VENASPCGGRRRDLLGGLSGLEEPAKMADCARVPGGHDWGMKRDRKLPVIGVMGSGSERHEEWSLPLGRALAGLPVHLLCGGGGGVMGAVSESFSKVEGRVGLVIGVLPGKLGAGGDYQGREGYPNRFVELVIRTHLPRSGAEGESIGSRNPINILSSDVVVVLPGGEGTASEARLAAKIGRPMITLGERRDGVPHAESVEEVEGFVGRVCGLS